MLWTIWLIFAIFCSQHGVSNVSFSPKFQFLKPDRPGSLGLRKAQQFPSGWRALYVLPRWAEPGHLDHSRNRGRPAQNNRSQYHGFRVAPCAIRAVLAVLQPRHRQSAYRSRGRRPSQQLARPTGNTPPRSYEAFHCFGGRGVSIRDILHRMRYSFARSPRKGHGF